MFQEHRFCFCHRSPDRRSLAPSCLQHEGQCLRPAQLPALPRAEPRPLVQPGPPPLPGSGPPDARNRPFLPPPPPGPASELPALSCPPSLSFPPGLDPEHTGSVIRSITGISRASLRVRFSAGHQGCQREWAVGYTVHRTHPPRPKDMLKS